MTNPGIFFGAAGGGTPDTLDSAGFSPDGGQNGLLVAGARKEVPFATTSVQAVAQYDCSDYRYVSVHIVAQGGSSTITFQSSNDGVNWVSVTLVSAAAIISSGTIPVQSTTGTGMFVGAVPGRYFRLNVTGIASGSTTGVVEFFTVPQVPTFQTGVVAVNGSTGGGVVQVGTASQTLGDAQSTSITLTNNQIGAAGLGYNGATLDKLRVPTTFKTATATASGNTALWTPTAGKKFRLMRFKIELTGDAAITSGAELDVTFQDASSGMAVASSFYCPATAVTTSANQFSSGWHDLGNGILSALANNVLNVNLSSALATGKCRVMVCGTEE